jgi:hypothetical protein
MNDPDLKLSQDTEHGLRVEQFKKDLARHESSRLVRRHIFFGLCARLDDDSYFELREVVSSQFKVHPSCIYVVGSSKLGFSIAPEKRYRAFGDQSDIDLAIVSDRLFDQFWTAVFDYNQNTPNWPDKKQFTRYLFRGWIRPDKLPSSPSFPAQRDWFEFFDHLSSTRDYGSFKLRAGLYRSWMFLENYQTICVELCKREQEIGL